jgi:hypothetical protein
MSNVKDERYLQADALVAPDLISPIGMSSQATTAYINIEGNQGDAFNGAIAFTTGANVNLDAPARDALTLYSGIDGTQAYIGEDGPAGVENILSINGEDGLGRVYDEIYNQPVSLQTITMLTENPLSARLPENTSEIFRTLQDGVASADSGSGLANTFTVPKTGFYALQIQLSLFNGIAPAVPDINVPAVVAPGGINVFGSIEFNLLTQTPLEVVPYGSTEVAGSELFISDVLLASSGISKVKTAMYLLQANTTYRFIMAVSRPTGSTAWNIGDNGQIKAELIAMC